MFDTPARPVSPEVNARIKQYTDELIAHTMRQWAIVEASIARQERAGSTSPPGLTRVQSARAVAAPEF